MTDLTRFTTKLFEKRDTFLVFINHMSYLDSNISSKKLYALVGSAILRITRITTDLTNVVTHVKPFLTWMKKQ